jgi:hypothetical protein
VTFATGMMLRYRAQALGIRHKEGGISLEKLVRRFLIVGLTLLLAVVVILVLLIVNYHRDPHYFGDNAQTILGSVARSLLTVGLILIAAPIISPFFARRPMRILPPAVADEHGAVISE